MIAYITGTSSGIGKALAELLLNQGHQVVGLSRRNNIMHPNYNHITIDLTDLSQLKAIDFSSHLNDDVILVNNAGGIGAIKPIGSQTADEIIELNVLNSIVPQILCNKFIAKYRSNATLKYQILNISSGASKRPIDAWATYCASKASINLFSETILEELKSRGYNNWSVFSISPGVVDTEMQSDIRSSNPNDFLGHQKFIDLKNNDELLNPKIIAEKMAKLIYSPSLFQSTYILLNEV